VTIGESQLLIVFAFLDAQNVELTTVVEWIRVDARKVCLLPNKWGMANLGG
jgi:hypothetical protein